MRTYSPLLLAIVCALLAIGAPARKSPASLTADKLLPSPSDSLPARDRPLRFFGKRQFHSADYESSSPPPRVHVKPASADPHQGVVSRAIPFKDSSQDGVSAKQLEDDDRDIYWRLATLDLKPKSTDTQPPLARVLTPANDPNTDVDTPVAKTVEYDEAALADVSSRDPKVEKTLFSHKLINHNHHGADDADKHGTGHHRHDSEFGQTFDELDEYCED